MMEQTLQPVTLKIDMAVIRAYAALTDDFNPIHLDPAFAAGTPMGGVIAHGTMSICLLWSAIFRSYGAGARDLDLDVRFVRPVRIGETLTAGGTPDPEDATRLNVWVRNENGEDRLVGVLRAAAPAAGGRT